MALTKDLERAFQTGAVVVDTETTGVTGMSEIVSISVIDHNRNVLLDTLVKPRNPIPYAASQIHGITAETVQDAPTWRDVVALYEDATRGKTILAYNCIFDKRMVQQTSLIFGVRNPARDWLCVMNTFSWSIGATRKFKLIEAANYMKLPMPEGNLHSAKTDALLTLHLALKLAGLE